MLNETQIASYNELGYLVVPDVVAPAVQTAVRNEYAALMDALYTSWFDQGRVTVSPENLSFWEKLRLSYEAGCDWFQPMDISLPGDTIYGDTPMHFGPAVFDLATHSNILDVVQSLIGPEITSNPIQHVRIKPPAPSLQGNEVRAHITQTDWHQDRGVGLEEADQTDMITVWIAITDATTENGCLQVIPRANQTMLPHCAKTQTAIADAFLDEGDAVPLPVKAGGIVILHPLAPHASLPNGTRDFRWSFDLRYNVTGQPTGRAHFPEFIARSENAPDTVLKDWRLWKKMWEDTRARLAVSPHIPIHRWDSTSPHCA